MTEVKPGDRVRVWLGGHGDQRVYGYGRVEDRLNRTVGVLLEGDWEDGGQIWRTSQARVTLAEEAA